jgi:hypothetical protein
VRVRLDGRSGTPFPHGPIDIMYVAESHSSSVEFGSHGLHDDHTSVPAYLL